LLRSVGGVLLRGFQVPDAAAFRAFAAGFGHPLLNYEFGSTPRTEVGSGGSGVPKALIIFAVVPGICEEVFYRGVILQGFRRGLGNWQAITVTSFLFAVMHMSPYRFFPQFAMGIMAGWLRVRTGSLVAPIVLHIGHNALLVIAGYVLGAQASWVVVAIGAVACAILAYAFWGPRRPAPAVGS
jgi:membrane protease YdiL (CAAX protease family)